MHTCVNPSIFPTSRLDSRSSASSCAPPAPPAGTISKSARSDVTVMAATRARDVTTTYTYNGSRSGQ